jgi:putative ABC transport system permease protein
MLRILEHLSVFARRVAARLGRAKLARNLEQELEHHLEMLERDLRAAGLPAADAHDAARRQLGNRTRIAESLWDSLSLAPVEALTRDLKFAIRTLRHSPGFALTVTLTLAVGIGATVTMFSIIDHVLLRPLPYPDADRLVLLSQRGAEGNQRLVSYPTLQDWSESASGFQGMAFVRGTGVTIGATSGPSHSIVAYVSPNFFGLVGMKAELGRTFAAEEELPSGSSVVVLSHDLWVKSFAADPRIIGRTVKLDSGSAVVIGVMPSRFAIPSWAALWRPLGQIIGTDPVLRSRDFHVDSRAIARLAPGVSASRAARLLSLVQRRIVDAYPDAEAKWTGVDVIPLRTSIVGDVSSALWTLGAGVIVALLIACVNVANLAAVRGVSRGREIAVRLALGASRIQVMRQLLIEMLFLALVGAAAGVTGSHFVISWLRTTAPFDLPRADELTIDARALEVTLLLTVFTAIIFGVLPAMRAAVPRAGGAHLLGSRSEKAGARRQSQTGAVLSAVQFALALLLLIAGGLLAQSYRRLQEVDLGFDPRELLSISVSPPKPKYSDPVAAAALYDRLVQRLRAVPGVDDVAVVNFMPLGGAGVPTRIEVPGRTPSSDDLATYVTVSDGYLRVMKIPLIRGRWFSPQESRAPGDGVVISESVAKKYWTGTDPLGKSITIFRSSQARPNFGRAVPSVVIGVVGDVRQFGVQNDPDPAVYVPLSAEPWPWATLVVRESTNHRASPSELRKAVLDEEPGFVEIASQSNNTFDPVLKSLSEELAPRRYILGLVSSFSLCALLLAAVGIYGVTGYRVTRSMHELGIRLALGATPRQILRTVLVSGLTPICIGCGIGLVAAFSSVRLMQHLLYGTSMADPMVLTSIPALLLTVGLLACYLPARRAASVDPMNVLRND